MKFSLKINKDDSYKVLGLLVKYNRISQKLSLRDLGKLANISHTLISNIEKGRVVSSKETLRELFGILKIDYFEDDEIISEFTPLYNKAFNYIYNYEYDKVKPIIKELRAKHHIYGFSIVLVDYYLLMYLYLGATNQIYGEELLRYELLLSLANFLTNEQKQMYHFIYGIQLYNQNMYLDSSNELKKALKVGNSDLDPLVNVYIVKCYVKMFVFMEATRIANNSIIIFENELNYPRAMELRLTMAMSYILVRKYDVAFLMIEKVKRFATFYNAPYLLGECCFLNTRIHLRSGNIETARKSIDKVDRKIPIVFFTKMQVALFERNLDLADKYYNEFLVYNKNRNSLMYLYMFDISRMVHGAIEFEDRDYLYKIEVIAELGKKGCDIEAIELSYELLIEYYKKKRMYKHALEACEIARNYRRHGCEK